MTENERTNTRSARRGEQGYLLLETLVASALLLFALLAIMPLYTMATRQNSFAKDVTIASSLALDKAEEFSRWRCNYIRRGTCCKEVDGPVNGAPNIASDTTDASCGYDDVKVENITYRRTCIIKQTVDTGWFSQDATDDAKYAFPYQGMAWIQVSVVPIRNSQFHKRTVKPSFSTAWRTCEPQDPTP